MNELLLSDRLVALTPVVESGEPVIHSRYGVPVRRGVERRLRAAASRLPSGLRLRVVEGLRSPADQRRIIEEYTSSLRLLHPSLTESELAELSARYVAPLAVAPHVAGAAVDLTLTDAAGAELDLGCPLDATPEESGGRCYFAAGGISTSARRLRDQLAEALSSAGFVNYPSEWWHWSYGDRYWAVTTGADHALYGPVGCLQPVPA